MPDLALAVANRCRRHLQARCVTMHTRSWRPVDARSISEPRSTLRVAPAVTTRRARVSPVRCHRALFSVLPRHNARAEPGMLRKVRCVARRPFLAHRRSGPLERKVSRGMDRGHGVEKPSALGGHSDTPAHAMRSLSPPIHDSRSRSGRRSIVAVRVLVPSTAAAASAFSRSIESDVLVIALSFLSWKDSSDCSIRLSYGSARAIQTRLRAVPPRSARP